MFFSRRIGIARTGAPVPIEWGSRLSGRTAGMEVGLIHMRTEGLEGVQPANDWSVARLARELPNRSSVGAIVTNRSAVGLDGNYGRTFAADANVGIGEHFNFSGVIGTVDRPGPTDSREAIVMNAEYRNRDWQVSGFYDHIGTNFVPEVGYLRRGSFRQVGGTVWRYYRPESVSWLRELQPHIGYDISHKLDGFKETEVLHFHLPIRWESGTGFSNAIDKVYDGLSRPYNIAPGVVVPVGSYEGWTWNSSFNTSNQRPLSFRAGADVGSFLSGDRRSGSVGLNLRQGSTLAGSVSMEHNKINLAQGSFDATLVRSRLAYAFSPSLFVQSLVQYGSQTKTFSGNIRLGWIDTAGTGLFIVYNERQLIEDIADGPLERSLVVKYTKQFNVSDMRRDLLGW
jgi:hypothetical protein